VISIGWVEDMRHRSQKAIVRTMAVFTSADDLTGSVRSSIEGTEPCFRKDWSVRFTSKPSTAHLQNQKSMESREQMIVVYLESGTRTKAAYNALDKIHLVCTFICMDLT